jgi:MFS transporter, DHA2 family, multidrug resistance protein
MALGVALRRVVVPPGQLGAAIVWNALAVALSSAAGPSIGAAVLAAANWPWLFAINLPLGALVLLATRASKHRRDGTSLGLIQCGIKCWHLCVFGHWCGTSPDQTGAGCLPARCGDPCIGSAGPQGNAEGCSTHPARPAPSRFVPLFSDRFGLLFCWAKRGDGCAPILPTARPWAGHVEGRTVYDGWPLTVAFAAPFAGRLADRVRSASRESVTLKP